MVLTNLSILQHTRKLLSLINLTHVLRHLWIIHIIPGSAPQLLKVEMPVVGESDRASSRLDP